MKQKMEKDLYKWGNAFVNHLWSFIMVEDS